MAVEPALIAHLKRCRLIYVSFWNNAESLGRGEARGDRGELSALSREAEMND